jgi:triosephosphate isomerase
MRKLVVAGNWKMNGSAQQSQELLKGLTEDIKPGMLANCDVLVCPPFVYLESLAGLLGNQSAGINLGAQDLSLHQNGAFTGQISAQMLQDTGCTYVLVGHSERRQFCHEDSQVVAAKAEVAIAAGLNPIICIGETQEQRDANKTEAVVKEQLSAVLERCSVEELQGSIIAYEPVWAIGTGLTATPEQAQAVHKLIRDILAKKSETLAEETAILYGGSVKGSNAPELFAMPDIDGGLIGGASLNLAEFVQICAAAVRIAR